MPVSVTCEECGAEFFVYPYRVANGSARYCSYACSGAGRGRQRYAPYLSDAWKERFWSKVAKGDGCWEWQGARFATGYGAIRSEGRTLLAHRVSWEIAHGPIPEGMDVCHHCDNPPCVRPDHLFLGVHLENMRDRDAKLRQNIGARNGQAKLSEDAVRDIRSRYAAGGVTQAQLGEEFGLRQSTVSQILSGERWKHLA